ncbi:MAG TPA: chromate transporter [Polyangiaceae bacterium]|jgi:chromate transporter
MNRELGTLAWAFLRLGTVAFGGPAAHIAMMEDEFVRRRQWLTRQEFLDLVGAASLIPGPSSTEVAIYVGYRRAGWRGLLLAGTCFILPAALIVTALAMVYVRAGHLPALVGALHGVKAIVIAVVAQALVGFARTAVKGPGLLALGAAAAAASLLGGMPVAILLGAGVLCLLVRAADGKGAAMVAPATAAGLTKLLAVFLKIGAVVFGSGYVLLAFLRDDVVLKNHWLTEGQLIDAVAVGQVTPGPVFTTATFIGYLVAGGPGAVVATVGIFLPSFLLVAVSGPLIPRLRRSRLAGAFLDGVNVASLALMVVVTLQLARAALVDVTTVALAVASAVLLFRWRVSSVWLVLGGGIVGVLEQLLR